MTENIISPQGQSITITVGAPPAPQGDQIKTEPSKELLQEGEKITKPDNVEKLIPQGDWRSDPLFFEVANFFGLKEVDYDGAKSKLADIVEFVIRDIESNDTEKVISKIREIEDKIQSAGWDERRYTNFHKYIRLAGKQQVIGQMMKAYEKK